MLYEQVPFLRDSDKIVNFVDIPGLLDSNGRDQEILDSMVEEMKGKCSRIDMFVLCFEQGKFDSGVQGMMTNYLKLLNDS